MATDIGNVQIYLGQWWNFGQNFDKRKNSILLTKVFKILKKFLASSLPKQTLLFRDAIKKKKQDISWHCAKFIWYLPTLPNCDKIYYDIFVIFEVPTHLYAIVTWDKKNLV